MIISYSLKNYRSYKDRQTLSFLAVPDRANAKRKSMFLYQDENICLTKLALIYGANATGKSNLFIGLSSFLRFVFSEYPKSYRHNPNPSYEDKSDFEVPYVPFFGEDGEAEHCLELYAPNQKKSYRYTLIATDQGIVKETLEEQRGHYNPEKYTTVFVRQNDKNLHFKHPRHNISSYFNRSINYGFTLRKDREQFVNDIADKAHPYQSLLYLLMVDSPYTYFQMLAQDLHNVQVRFSKMEQSRDLFLGKTVYQHLKERGSVYKTLLNFIRITNTYISDITVTHGDRVVLHYDYNGSKHAMHFSDVSEGTKKICYLSRDILTVLWEGGSLLGDELDGEIHPFILALIFEIFLAPQYNSQMVCTLHTPVVVDLLNRLKNEALPRSMVYFALKAEDGGTELKSYAQFLGNGLMKKNEFVNFVVQNRYLFAPDARTWMFEDFLLNFGS